MNLHPAMVLAATLATATAQAEIASIKVVSGTGANVAQNARVSLLASLDLSDSEDTVLLVELSNSPGFEPLFLKIQDPQPFDGLDVAVGTLIDDSFLAGGPMSILSADYDGLPGTSNSTGFTFGLLAAQGTLGLRITGLPNLDSFALRISPTFAAVPEPATGGVLLIPMLVARRRRT